MKELLRITYSLTRPSKIGIFNKDNIIIPILHALFFYVLLVGVIFAIALNTKYFGKSTSDSIVNYLGNQKFSSQIVLEDNKIYYDSDTNKMICEYENGKNYSSKSSGIYIYFSYPESQKVIPQDYLVLDFSEDYVSVYYNTIFTNGEKRFYYKDSFSKSFDLAKAASGNISDYIEASNLFNEALANVNINYQIYDAILSSSQVFLYYALVMLFLLVLSTFTNSQIAMLVRTKLVIYDSIPYLFIMTLTYLIGFSYLQYIALFLPFVYTIITFRHILRLKK